MNGLWVSQLDWYVHTCFLCSVAMVCCAHTSPRPMVTGVMHNVWMCVCMHTHTHSYIHALLFHSSKVVQATTMWNTRTHTHTHTHNCLHFCIIHTHILLCDHSAALYYICHIVTSIGSDSCEPGVQILWTKSVCMHTSVKRHTLCFLFLVSMGNHEANTARTTLTPSRVKQVATKCMMMYGSLQTMGS